MYYNKKGQSISQTEWYETFKDKRVGLDYFGEVMVSTVLLGLDHNYSQVGPPIIFETMIFGLEELEDYQERYATEEEALEGHNRAVEKVKGIVK
jgi:hypothetical protein